MNAVLLLLVIVLLLLATPLRRRLLTAPLLRQYRRVLPSMSATEKTALEAGSVWWEGQLFTGRPDWQALLAFPPPRLSAAEQAFLDEETEALCRLANDWQTQQSQDLSSEAWQYLKDMGFLGLIIPREYGGKGFSAYAHSQVVMKLSTRCSAAAVSVMVPNSLGPAELLLRYGSEAQKRYYLPRLARGQEIPAFALTSPQAGSDAASIPDRGIVCKGLHEGREVLGMRLTWDKRYITLGPICSLLGLAFRLYDPEHLLGEVEDLGITCALIPARHPGVIIGRRHAPLNAVFQNGPNSGKDVFVPLDFIIGGPAMAGQGWRMLMECLAAGRAISLPASNTGVMKLTARSVGAYARVRAQFKTAIGRFEGVEEPLARIGGKLYMADAARRLTLAAIDRGEHPAVLSAILKYHITESARQVVNDGMDVLGGKGICLGPQNFLARAYQQMPIAITVEGANILTRSLIIFGQGALRCHPYLLKEMQAAQDADAARGLRDFDAAVWRHLASVFGNAARSLLFGLGLVPALHAPAAAPESHRYIRQLRRWSAAFALLVDFSLLCLGGQLKRREKLSARLGDMLSLLYLSAASLKRFEDEGRQAADAPLLHWALQDALMRLQLAAQGVLDNFPSRPLACVLRVLIFPLGARQRPPSDALGHAVASLLIEPSASRDRLLEGSYVQRADEEDPVAVLEMALEACVQAERIEARLRAAHKAGQLAGGGMEEWAAAAAGQGLISAVERVMLARRDALRQKVIRVDDFPPDLSARESFNPPPRSVARAA
jgi:acyl-CoA dehydrogenase